MHIYLEPTNKTISNIQSKAKGQPASIQLAGQSSQGLRNNKALFGIKKCQGKKIEWKCERKENLEKNKK